MDKPNITEGPWEMMKFLNDDESIASAIITIDSGDESTKIIASLYNEDLYEDELVANAGAISAVPEMLDALILAHRILKDRIENKGLYPPNDPTFTFVKKALEKAGVEL